MTSLLIDGLCYPSQKAEIKEEWKDIPGFEGIYEASNKGQIRTCIGKTTYTMRHGVRTWKQRVLKQKWQKRAHSDGKDAHITLWKDGKPFDFLVSRLIALTWCDGFEDGFTVNHIDGNPKNNNAYNLEWVSLADNIRKGMNNGLYHTMKPVTLISPNGERLDFASMAKASLYLGMNKGYINNRLSRGWNTTPDGYEIIVQGETYDE